VGSDGVVQSHGDFIKDLADLSHPPGRDIAPIGDDIGSKPAALGIARNFQEIATVKWFPARKNKSADAGFHCLVHEVITLRGGQFVISSNRSVLITVGATKVAGLRTDPI